MRDTNGGDAVSQVDLELLLWFWYAIVIGLVQFQSLDTCRARTRHRLRPEPPTRRARWIGVVTTSPRRAKLYMVLRSDQRASMDRYGHELANAINRWVPDFVAHTVTLAEKRRVPTGKAFARFLRA